MSLDPGARGPCSLQRLCSALLSRRVGSQQPLESLRRREGERGREGRRDIEARRTCRAVGCTGGFAFNSVTLHRPCSPRSAFFFNLCPFKFFITPLPFTGSNFTCAATRLSSLSLAAVFQVSGSLCMYSIISGLLTVYSLSPPLLLSACNVCCPLGCFIHVWSRASLLVGQFSSFWDVLFAKSSLFSGCCLFPTGWVLFSCLIVKT